MPLAELHLIKRMKNIIQNYLQALEAGSADEIIKLFANDGIVHSPLYGSMPMKDFYKDLFSDTRQSTITLLNIFNSLTNERVYAAHFRYEWILVNGSRTNFECVDIFQFNEEGKITEMTIIYDTNKTRKAFEELE